MPYDVVPETGPLENGAMEINKTRDYLAELKAILPENRQQLRLLMRISSGTANPGAAVENHIYFRTE